MGQEKGFSISQRRKMITQVPDCQEGNPGKASGEENKCWRGYYPSNPTFSRDCHFVRASEHPGLFIVCGRKLQLTKGNPIVDAVSALSGMPKD